MRGLAPNSIAHAGLWHGRHIVGEVERRVAREGEHEAIGGCWGVGRISKCEAKESGAGDRAVSRPSKSAADSARKPRRVASDPSCAHAPRLDRLAKGAP